MIYIDMDGVLADFVRGSLRIHNIGFTEEKYNEFGWDYFKDFGFTWQEFFAKIDYNAEFWANLDPIPEGIALVKALIKRFGVDHVGILSSGKSPHSTDGKRLWLRKYLPELESGATFCCEKWRHAHPCAILIDDYKKNVDEFRDKGGIAFYFPQPWNKSEVRHENIEELTQDVIDEYCRFIDIDS